MICQDLDGRLSVWCQEHRVAGAFENPACEGCVDRVVFNDKDSVGLVAVAHAVGLRPGTSRSCSATISRSRSGATGLAT